MSSRGKDGGLCTLECAHWEVKEKGVLSKTATNHKEGTPMRELDFATEQNVMEAYKEIRNRKIQLVLDSCPSPSDSFRPHCLAWHVVRFLIFLVFSRCAQVPPFNISFHPLISLPC